MKTRALAPAVAAALSSAVGHGLEGATPWPTEPLSERDFDECLRVMGDDRLLGAFAEAAADATLELLPYQLDELKRRHALAQAHVLQLERLLLDAADVFSRQKIGFRLLKGAALAHTVYSDPSWRVFSDVDLLVPSDQLDLAVEAAIHELNGKRALPELRKGFDREFGKESLVRVGRLELDLHRTLAAGPFGLTIDLDELFKDNSPVTIGGRTMLGLGGDHQFLNACYNAALGDHPVRLSAVRDLLLCADQLNSEPEAIVGIASGWSGRAVVQRAAQLTIGAAGQAAARRFVTLANISVPKREVWLMKSYLSAARSYTRPMAGLAVIPGIGPRLRYARALIAPDGDYLRSRGWTARTHIGRAVGRLRPDD